MLQRDNGIAGDEELKTVRTRYSNCKGMTRRERAGLVLKMEISRQFLAACRACSPFCGKRESVERGKVRAKGPKRKGEITLWGIVRLKLANQKLLSHAGFNLPVPWSQ